MVKPDPEGLSIRPCVWPVGRRAYPRSGFCLGGLTFLAAAKVDLDAPETDAVGGVGRSIDALEYSPAAALPFQHYGFALFTEFHQVQMVSGPHRRGYDHRLGKPALVERKYSPEQY